MVDKNKNAQPTSKEVQNQVRMRRNLVNQIREGIINGRPPRIDPGVNVPPDLVDFDHDAWSIINDFRPGAGLSNSPAWVEEDPDGDGDNNQPQPEDQSPGDLGTGNTNRTRESGHPNIPGWVIDIVHPDEEEVLDAVAVPQGHSLLVNLSKDSHVAPLVTIFGAGVAGLTAAHELIERGFVVQIVEEKRRLDKEDECEVGGLAASQFGRIKETRKLHPYLFLDEQDAYPELLDWDRDVNWYIQDDGKWPSLIKKTRIVDASSWRNADERQPNPVTNDLESLRTLVLKMRDRPFQRVQQQFDMSPRIAFEENIAFTIDEFAQSNLMYVSVELLKAFARYRQDLEYEMAPLLSEEEIANLTLLEASQKKLRNLDDEFVIRESIFLEIRGHARTGTENALKIAQQRAMAVKASIVDVVDYLLLYAKNNQPAGLENYYRVAIDEFEKAFPNPEPSAQDKPYRIKRLLEELKPTTETRLSQQSIENYLLVVSAADAQPVGNPAYEKDRQRSDRVEFHMIEHAIPGEHGFRFFPAFYRHLFDTMKRTPLLDDDGVVTHRSAFDQLVEPPASAVGLADDDEPPKAFPRGRPQSLAELRERANYMRDKLGMTNRDFMRATTQILKFLTSSPRRRELYEEMSFLRYIDGDSELNPRIFDDFHNPGKKTSYSDAAEKLILELPQLLVAMSAEESDAHTNMAVTVQLMLESLGQDKEQDLILNGPTSTSWLRPWKDYLSRQGVRFYTGHIQKLQWDSQDQEIRPIARSDRRDDVGGVVGPGSPTPEPYVPEYSEEADFYILALPLPRVVPLVRQIFEDTPTEEHQSIRGDIKQLLEYCELYNLKADPETDEEPGKAPILDERDIAGKPLHPMQYPLRDLVGIQYYFRHHFQFERSHVNYLQSPWNLSSISQAFHWLQKPSRTAGFLGQLSVDIGDMYAEYPVLQWFSQGQDLKSAWQSNSAQIATATWIQIMATASRNYATSPPTYYHLDRGLEFDPEHGFVDAQVKRNKSPLLINLPGQWRNRPGLRKNSNGPTREIEYKLTTNRWTMAGTFMATHTRLTTMEAACESARHAVNAILKKLDTTLLPPLYNSGSRRLGDDCGIWNPADNELKDLDYLKEIDEGLVEEGQPHLFDMLGLLSAVDRMPNEERGLRWALEQAMAHHKGMAEDLVGDQIKDLPTALSGLMGEGLEQVLGSTESLKELINGTKRGRNQN